MPKVHDVVASEDGRAFAWNLELPPEQLDRIRGGERLESPPFALGPDTRARFHFYPKGDTACSTAGMCSLWLWTDAPEPRRVRLRVGEERRGGGASEFCLLGDALRNGVLEVGLEVDGAPAGERAADRGATSVHQSLHLTGLEVADWQVFDIQRVLASGDLVTSPPFRFHHVLLGDMYLELRPGAPHPEHCTIFFRCRVPTMKLRVNIAVGDAFSKSFVALGRSGQDADVVSGSCLALNLDAPGVLCAEGSLRARCTLEEVVLIPAALRDLIPKLDERAQWPKRL